LPYAQFLLQSSAAADQAAVHHQNS
jgi:hypothetical protein